MSKSDVEMEDAEKLPNQIEDAEKLSNKVEGAGENLTSELGDNVQESESKTVVSEVESKGEMLPSEPADQEISNGKESGEDLMKCTVPAVDSEAEVQIKPISEGVVKENGGPGPEKCADAVAEESTADGEVEEEVLPSSEAVEPVSVEEPEEPNNDKIKDVDFNQMKSNGEEQIDAVEKHVDTQNTESEHVKQNSANDELKEAQLSDKNDDHVKVGEKKPIADIVDTLLEESNRVDGVAEEESTMVTGDGLNDPKERNQVPAVVLENKEMEDVAKSNEVKPALNDPKEKTQVPAIVPENKEMEDVAKSNEVKPVKNEQQQQQEKVIFVACPVSNRKVDMVDSSTKLESNEPATPKSVVKYPPSKDGEDGGQTVRTVYTQATLPPMAEGDDGTPEDQATFLKELESYHRSRSMDFKQPKFYGQPLNCLKLWRSVIRLGGYDRVTGLKLWRQVGESFHPPKTCTTVSWTFRIFYEKSLLEFERHKKHCGELQLPLIPDSGAENEGNGHQGPGSASGRARRDSATRAMQGWHVQRISDDGEVAEPIIKDKNPNNTGKREKGIKSIGSVKQKKPSEIEESRKVARTESYQQLVTSVVDVGPPADWVKIKVRQTQDCFEVYALVPGLLREEVRVQSDPAGRLVITGHPEQEDNPWGITPFKKVVSLPARIDPLQTSAVVSLHGRLFVRVPFEQSTNT